MKTPILLLLMVFSASHMQAQQNDDKLFYLQKAEKYRRMKTTGAVLTGLGSIAFIAGIVTVSNATYTTTTNGYGQPVTTSSDGDAAAGVLSFLAGSLALGAGVPLWIVGAHAKKKYERKLEGLTFRMNFHQQRAGFTLTCRLGQ